MNELKLFIFGILSLSLIIFGGTLYKQLNNDKHFLGYRSQINVKSYGAKGDGITDDTRAIQTAIDETSKQKKILFFPRGIYLIKAHVDQYKGINYLRNEGGIYIKSNSHLILDPNANLKAIPTKERQYNIVRIWKGENITIEGGTISGERNEHLSTGGEWGYGLAIFGSKNIRIKNVTIKDCWGDGINLQLSEPDFMVNRNIVMKNVICSNNRRQGMSIEAGEDLTFQNCTFQNTNGTSPKSGVDIEPWHDNIDIKNVTFTGCTFKDNAGNNLLINYPHISNLIVERCSFIATNKKSVAQHIYSTFYGATFLIKGCQFDNKVENILLRGGKGRFEGNSFNNNVTINYPEDNISINRTDSIIFIENTFRNVTLLASRQNNLVYLKDNNFLANNTLFFNNKKVVMVDNDFINNKSKFLAIGKGAISTLNGNTFKNNNSVAVEVYSDADLVNNSFTDVATGILVFSPAKNVNIQENSFKKIHEFPINFLDANLSKKNRSITIERNTSDGKNLINPAFLQILNNGYNKIQK